MGKLERRRAARHQHVVAEIHARLRAYLAEHPGNAVAVLSPADISWARDRPRHRGE